MKHAAISNSTNRQRPLKTGLWVQLISRTCALHALPSVFASAVGDSGKTTSQKRLAPDSLIYSVPATLPTVFFCGLCSFVKMSRIIAPSQEMLTLLSLFAVQNSTPLLLGSRQGVGSLDFRWSFADNFWVLARGVNCTNVHLARLIAVVNEFVSMFMTYPLQAELQMFSDMRCHKPNCVAVEQANGQHVSAQSRGRSLRVAGERWSSLMVTNLSYRSATVELSQPLTPASSSRGRPVWWQGSHGQACAWNREYSGDSCHFGIDCCAGLIFASVRTRRKMGSRSRSVKDVVS